MTEGEDFFYDRMENIEKKLSALNCYQIHKSFCVNLSHVVIFKYHELQMSNGDVLRISTVQAERNAGGLV